MAHGPTILEMVKYYKKQAKNFEKMTEDIMTNKTEYFGQLSITDDFILLVGLFSDTKQNAIYVTFYRAWPKLKKASESEFTIYLSKALNIFPEIIKMEFIKGKWPAPYNNEGK
ncbi:MAG TPA: hypothetical protein ENI23_01175 [bacterium]|nr:hypothetical protein [bacterium]